MTTHLAWQNASDNPLPDWVQGRGFGGAGGTLHIVTCAPHPPADAPAQIATVLPGDWIIQQPDGSVVVAREKGGEAGR